MLTRPGMLTGYSVQDVCDFLDYLLSVSVECRVYFLWRPHLIDPKDDLILEVALAGGASFIVTHNTRHFGNVDSLGIRAVTPAEFLVMVESSS